MVNSIGRQLGGTFVRLDHKERLFKRPELCRNDVFVIGVKVELERARGRSSVIPLRCSPSRSRKGWQLSDVVEYQSDFARYGETYEFAVFDPWSAAARRLSSNQDDRVI